MPTTHRTHLEQVLAQRQKELAAAQSLVAQLSEQCVHLRREINAIAPIMLLPIELKLDIFRLCKLENSHDTNDPMVALLLAAVCSQWREIVLNMPQLWDTIHLPLYNRKTGHYMKLDQTKLSILQEWLSRGQEGPLSMEVVLRHEEWNSEQDEWPPFPEEDLKDISQTTFLKTIMEQSHRWKHISFHGIIAADFKHKVFRGRRCLGLLHSLCIENPGDDYQVVGQDSDDPVFIPTFSDAPLLREAKIRGFALSEEIRLPWGQLETLYGEGDVENLYNVFCQGHNLIDCEVWIDDSWAGLNLMQRVTVSKLQRLTLHGVGRFLRVLDLPSLTYLALDLDPDDYPNFDDILSDLVEHSSCPLKDLIVSSCTLEADSMRYMRLLPSLTTLDISSTNGMLPPDFLEGLAADENTLLPNLTVLKYDGKTDFHFGTLYTMLQKRLRKQKNSIAQLKSVSIISTNDIPSFDEVAIEELETLVSHKEGLQIEIKVEGSRVRGWQNSSVSD